MESLVMFNSVYQNKKVLVTGHTGFKGAWLSTWLLTLGAKVYGISDTVPTTPSLFQEIKLQNQIIHYQEDVRNAEKIKKIIHDIKPDYIFHLAAQAIVKTSFSDPLLTFSTNALGTASILDALRDYNEPCNVICITSDKCYENVEWTWGYRENDHLGGKDPYSASKACAENIIYAYFHSFFNRPESKIRLCSTRAGNVIGGGDWADARIVPDCFRAWAQSQSVTLRNPKSTRPWQHVLEPLSGYLRTGQLLSENPQLNGEAFNFGPPAEQTFTVLELLNKLKTVWPKQFPSMFTIESSDFHEANLLKLNCDKALHTLSWTSTLNFQETCDLTADWYTKFYVEKANMEDVTKAQIKFYTDTAKNRGKAWA